MERFRCIYKSIADGQKVGYWTVVTNVLLILITFWLGLVVQDSIAKKNANASGAMANIEYVEKVKPCIDTLNIRHGGLFFDFVSLSSHDKKGNYVVTDQDAEKMKAYLKEHTMDFTSYYDDLLEAWSYISHFDSQYPKDIQAAACTLPVFAVMIDYVNDYVDKQQSTQSLKWEYGWDSLEMKIKARIKQPDYISYLGLNVNMMSDTIMGLVKQLYMAIGDKPKEEKDYQLLLVTLPQAISVHKWVIDHSTFKPIQDNTPVSYITDKPLRSLFFLVVVGLFLAWGITMLLPEKKEKTSSEKLLEQLVQGLKGFAAQFTSNQKTINKLIEEVVDLKSKISEMGKGNNPPADGAGDDSTKA